MKDLRDLRDLKDLRVLRDLRDLRDLKKMRDVYSFVPLPEGDRRCYSEGVGVVMNPDFPLGLNS
jgi:hypothetical protein